MKTVFIPIFQGVEARNILRTDIFKFLKQQNQLRIVLFVSDWNREKYFKKEVSGENIFFEVFDHYQNPTFNKIFTFLKLSLTRTKTIDLRRKEAFLGSNRYFSYFLYLFLSRFFAYKPWRRLIRWLDWKLVRDRNFVEVFDKYQPDLVFLAHIFGDEETSMLRQARKRGIKSMAFINSWDKITSRCMVRLLPDKMIVHNEIVKKEAIKYADMPPENIEIVGVPNCDIFVNAKPSRKEEFCAKVGLDAKKKILMFCPLGKRYSDIDAEIINIISDFKIKNLLPGDVQILVRFPPNDIVDLSKIKNKELLTFYQPGVRFTTESERRVDWDMNEKDIQLLLDSLFHSSLLVCQASSLSIDASIFNKPIINFQIKSETGVKPPRDGNWLYELSHYQPILQSGGVRRVTGKEELLEWINKYLNNSEIDSAGRKKIVAEQCWKLDGQAGKRTAEFIIDFTKSIF